MSTTTPGLCTLFIMKDMLVFKGFSKSSILYIFCRMLKLGHDKQESSLDSWILTMTCHTRFLICIFFLWGLLQVFIQKASFFFKLVCECVRTRAHTRRMCSGTRSHRSGLDLLGASYELYGRGTESNQRLPKEKCFFFVVVICFVFLCFFFWKEILKVYFRRLFVCFWPHRPE